MMFFAYEFTAGLETRDYLLYTAARPSMASNTWAIVAAGFVPAAAARQATTPSGRTSTAPDGEMPIASPNPPSGSPIVVPTWNT